MGSWPPSSIVSPQMPPKFKFWFRMLSTQWWESPPLGIIDIYGEKQQMDGANNVRLEYQMW